MNENEKPPADPAVEESDQAPVEETDIDPVEMLTARFSRAIAAGDFVAAREFLASAIEALEPAHKDRARVIGDRLRVDPIAQGVAVGCFLVTFFIGALTLFR